MMKSPAFLASVAFGAAMLTLGAAAPASALEVRVTITNTAAIGGFSLTPVYFSFHDGSFDMFDEGGMASPGVEQVAELGDPTTLRMARLALHPSSVGAALGSPSGPPPVEPGESVSQVFNLDPVANRYLNFISMILPSNDAFVGNDNPTAYDLFGASGLFSGPLEIIVNGTHAYDAGTEANDPANGPAFVAGLDILAGLETADPITRADIAQLIADFTGLPLATGATIAGLSFTDLTSFEFARISVELVEAPAVPLPAAAPLLVGALAILGVGAHRRRRKA